MATGVQHTTPYIQEEGMRRTKGSELSFLYNNYHIPPLCGIEDGILRVAPTVAGDRIHGMVVLKEEFLIPKQGRVDGYRYLMTHDLMTSALIFSHFFCYLQPWWAACR